MILKDLFITLYEDIKKYTVLSFNQGLDFDIRAPNQGDVLLQLG